MPETYDLIEHWRHIPVKKYQFGTLIFLLLLTYFFPCFLTGVFWGIYASTVAFLYVCVSDPIDPQKSKSTEHDKLLAQLQGKCECDDRQDLIYKGWINFFDGIYEAHNFNINSVQTVLIRLEGKMLRVLKPERVMLKHGVCNDPTLSENDPQIIQQTVYDLTGATICLRPRRLAPRRWFSRRYPICIKLSDKSERVSKIPRQMSSASVDMPKSVPDNKSRSHSEANDDMPRLCRRATIDINTQSIDLIPDSQVTSDDDELFMPRTVSEAQLPRGNSLINRFRKSKLVQEQRPARVIYLFARTAREKERWFHLLRKTILKDTDINDKYFSAKNRKHSFGSNPLKNQSSLNYFLYITHAINFKRHLQENLQVQVLSNVDLNGVILMDLGRSIWKELIERPDRGLVKITNLLASRIFYDFCRDLEWISRVQCKIQNKLSSIHLPDYVEKLELSDFEITTAIPIIEKISNPVVNDWGTWIDFQIKYEGLIKLVLETRVNLMSMKERRDSNEGTNSGSESKDNGRRYTRYSDDEIPESPESSAEENYGAKLKANGKGKKKGKSMLNMINKITNSNLFQGVAGLKPVQKVMEDFSSKRLVLNVEITQLNGVITVNMAPPPSDRIWYAFRKTPTMSIRAIPQIGDRAVAFSVLSDWIEKKLIQLLERNLVLPNMDDVRIPFMSGSELLQNLSA